MHAAFAGFSDWAKLFRTGKADEAPVAGKLLAQFAVEALEQLLGRPADGGAVGAELDDVHPALAPLTAGHEQRRLTHSLRHLALVEAGRLPRLPEQPEEGLIFAGVDGFGYGDSPARTEQRAGYESLFDYQK